MDGWMAFVAALSLQHWSFAVTSCCILLIYSSMINLKDDLGSNTRRWMVGIGFHTAVSIVVGSLLCIIVVRKIIPPATNWQTLESKFTKYVTTVTVSNNTDNVPNKNRTKSTSSDIVFIEMNKIEWKVLQTCLNSYRSDLNNILENLSMILEVVELEEKLIEKKGFTVKSGGDGFSLSNLVRRKILRLSEVFDYDMKVLEDVIIVPFSTIYALPTFALPSASFKKVDNDLDEIQVNDHNQDDTKNELKFSWGLNKSTDKFDSYDSIRQVIAHLVRDWSPVEGALIRKSIYDWCVTQLQLYQFASNQHGPILVPGAGLGRLVWEISRQLNCTVEAIESSVCMTAAAHTMLHLNKKNAFSLHPYAADAFSNEIDSDARFDEVFFPDVNPSMREGTISYTVGKFSYDSMQHCPDQYGAIVTCFFIDTATTIYDFVATIAMILSTNGLWINVGPLQWHINNQVPVAVDELRMILDNFTCRTTGKKMFYILHWSVDKVPTRYRNDGGSHRSTYYDGYCPLRFVIRKTGN